MGLEDFTHRYGALIVLAVTALIILEFTRYHICLKCLHFSLRERVVTTVERKGAVWVSADIHTTRCDRAGCRALRRHHIVRRPSTKEEIAAMV